MINLKELKNCSSFIESNQEIESLVMDIQVDNRALGKESLFIAIVGERFNPLEHLEKVVSSGCKYVVCESSDENKSLTNNFSDSINFIFVKLNQTKTNFLILKFMRH
mgnify:CR=1 FL=1